LGHAGDESAGGFFNGSAKRYVHTPRPYVATTSVSGSFGLRLTMLIGTTGRPVSAANAVPPRTSDANTPTSVPTTICPPRSATVVTGTSGRFPETSLNVAPASVDLKRCPSPTSAP
jgi:hypothetical protein